MNTSKLADTAEICSSIAIVVTLVILIIEVRGNTEAIKIQKINGQNQNERERRSTVFRNAGGIADVIVKSMNKETLSRVEDLRLTTYYNDMLDNYEWQFGEVQSGRLPESHLNVSNWGAIWRGQPHLVLRF
jgi:hypothetical protein